MADGLSITVGLRDLSARLIEAAAMGKAALLCAESGSETRAEIDGKAAIQVVFRSYEAALTRAGFLAMGGQILDATVVAAPKEHNTDDEKAEIRAGRIPLAWTDKPSKLAQNDRDARWTVKFSKAKPSDDGSSRIDLAVPAFGYKNHITIDRRHGLIRTWIATHDARHDGAQLPALVS